MFSVWNISYRTKLFAGKVNEQRLHKNKDIRGKKDD